MQSYRSRNQSRRSPRGCPAGIYFDAVKFHYVTILDWLTYYRWLPSPLMPVGQDKEREPGIASDLAKNYLSRFLLFETGWRIISLKVFRCL